MKKAEIILGAISIIAAMLDIFLVPGGRFLTIFSLSALATLYMYGSFALLNGVRLRQIFKKGSFKGVGYKKMLGSIGTGLALAITVVGLLFTFQSWPNENINLGFGLFWLLIVLIISGIKYLRTRSSYYVNILKRIAIYGGLGLVLLPFPSGTWLKLKYNKHPEYIEAVKKAQADPNNELLWTKVEEELEKMDGSK